MPQNETEFTRVLRGYDSAEVDRTVNQLRRELLALKTDHDQQVEAVFALTAELEEFRTNAELRGRPTFSGLGARLASTLTVAEEHAARLVARAEADAHALSVDAVSEAESIRNTANTDARLIRESASVAAEEILSDAQNRSKILIIDAENYASGIRKDAENAAREIRGASATEISNARTTSKRELEQKLAESQRQIAEARLVFVAKTSEEHDVDVDKKLMEILRLHADNAVRIDEAEAEFLARHQEAVTQTQKYIDDAQVQAALARTNAAERERIALELEQEAIETARVLREEAADRVSSLTSDAEARAKKILADAERRSTKMVAEAEATVADLRVEREAVAANFEALRLVLGQASDVMSDTGTNFNINR